MTHISDKPKEPVSDTLSDETLEELELLSNLGPEFGGKEVISFDILRAEFLPALLSEARAAREMRAALVTAKIMLSSLPIHAGGRLQRAVNACLQQIDAALTSPTHSEGE